MRSTSAETPLPLRILVIEDHADTAASMAMYLRLQGQLAETAADGLTGLNLARSWEPHVVLLDVGLPGMTGLEVARLLREEAGERRPLVIAITGYGSTEDRLRGEEAGTDLYLVKPVDPSELQQLLVRFQSIVAR